MNAIIYGYRFISVGEVIQEGLSSDATKPTTETDEINGIEIPTSINGIWIFCCHKNIELR